MYIANHNNKRALLRFLHFPISCIMVRGHFIWLVYVSGVQIGKYTYQSMPLEQPSSDVISAYRPPHII